jgi:hypothetical protein
MHWSSRSGAPPLQGWTGDGARHDRVLEDSLFNSGWMDSAMSLALRRAEAALAAALAFARRY